MLLNRIDRQRQKDKYTQKDISIFRSREERSEP